MAKQNESAGQEPKRRGKRGPRSDKPERILAFLRDYFAEFNYPPSVRDIVEGCNLSSTSVADYNLKILENEGHITRDRERARTIALTKPLEPAQVLVGAPEFQVPLLGLIGASGDPYPDSVDAEHADEHITVTEDMLGTRDPENIVAFTVRGDSMIDALIADKDTLLVKQTSEVVNGQMAAVWLRDEEYRTVKRIYKEGRKIRLQPENPTMDPIITDESNVIVQGQVVSVIRHPR